MYTNVCFGGENEELVDLPGGTAYPDMMEMLGVPPPLVPHGAPHSAAPAASLVARALANARPLPSVEGGPILSKPSSVHVRLRLGFFDVTVTGSAGERAFFRLPLRKAAPSPDGKGLMVANFVTASVGLLDSVALVGPQKRPILSVDVLVRSVEASGGERVSLAAADALVSGCPAPSLEPRLIKEASLVGQFGPDTLGAAHGSGGIEAAAFAELAGAERQSVAAGPVVAPARPLPVQALALEAAPVAGTLWQVSPPERQPRRCSRLARGRYVSIIDRAIARKKELLGSSTAEASSRRGELLADDLFAVAIEEDGALPDMDVQVLAAACDIDRAELDLAQVGSLVPPMSP